MIFSVTLSTQVACDSYHHYDRDVALMAEMGLNSYRCPLSPSTLLSASSHNYPPSPQSPPSLPFPPSSPSPPSPIPPFPSPLTQFGHPWPWALG